MGDYAALTHFEGMVILGWMGFTLECLMVVGSSGLLVVGWGGYLGFFGVRFSRKNLFDALIIQNFWLS